jgi:lysophospholipase L1-like esterase
MQDAIAQADIVVLASSWQLWSAQQLPQTLKQLALKPTQQLIVVGRKSFGTVKPADYAKHNAAELRQLRNPVDNNQVAINETLQRLLPAQQFIDMQTTICDAVDTCPLFTPDLQLISFDGGHLTQAGAAFVGEQLLKNPLIQALRAD